MTKNSKSAAGTSSSALETKPVCLAGTRGFDMSEDKRAVADAQERLLFVGPRSDRERRTD